MNGLRLSPKLQLPIDVAGEAIAILAKRGAGKTNTATVLVEELYAAGVQVVILDPVGSWWGIRSSGDGKGEGLAIARLGGEHGDVPLEPTAGALIADVAVDSGQSLLIDLSDFPSKSATNRFVTDFAERLYRRKARHKQLLHLVLEEADEFAPQKGMADTARMRGAIEQIVRRGRGRGLGITMITQRSGTLTGFKITGGTFQTYFSQLKRLGLIVEDNREIWVTEAGLDFAGVTAAEPMSTEELLAMWRGALKAGARQMLDVLVAQYPASLMRDQLADLVEMAPTGGTFQTYLSTLRRNGLIEVSGSEIVASDTLFIGGVHAS